MGGYARQSSEMVDELHMVFQLICPVNFLVMFAAVEDSLFCGKETSSVSPCFLPHPSSYVPFVVRVELSEKYILNVGL